MQRDLPALRRRIATRALAVAVLAAGGGSAVVQAAPAGDTLGMAASTNPLARAIPAAELRWQSSMAAFAASDRAKAPATDGVLFVGSSTIRMWTDLAQDFRKQPVVINRGFGGSTMADCTYFVKQLVLQYKPRQVLVYAGDNDLAEGRTPEQVLESFQSFVRTVRQELPHAHIDYISIKPSPLRASLMPKVREANALLAAYVRTVPNAQYIDIFTPMLDATGAPRMELFGQDRLHMNEAGYDLWQSVIGAYVDAPGGNPADRPATLATSAPPAASTPAPVLAASAAAAPR